MGTEQALRGKIRITQGEAQRLKVLLRDAHNRLHHEVRKQVSEVYASLGGTRSVKGALQILWQQYELGDDGARPIIDYSNRDTDLRVLTSTARYIAAYIVRDKIRDEGAVRKPTVADIENEVPLAGRSVIGFGMYNGGGRMDASAVIEGGVITWESFGKDWPDDIRETYIARHLFRFLDSYSWTARTGGELVNYIQDGWDEPGSNSTIYASYGNPRAVDGA